MTSKEDVWNEDFRAIAAALAGNSHYTQEIEEQQKADSAFKGAGFLARQAAGIVDSMQTVREKRFPTDG